MLGTFRTHWFDRPVIMTVTHFLAIAVAVIVAAWFRSTLAVYAALILFLAVPLAATLYRTLQNGLPQPIVRGTLLYHLYFDARLAALGMIICATVRRPYWIIGALTWTRKRRQPKSRHQR